MRNSSNLISLLPGASFSFKLNLVSLMLRLIAVFAPHYILFTNGEIKSYRYKNAGNLGTPV